MNVLQCFRMAFKSILAKKGRAVLTILSIFIGVAAVIVLVSRQQAQTDQWMDYIKKTSTNRIDIYASMWGGKDFTSDLYRYCLQLGDLVEGVTPNQSMYGARIKYGAKDFELQQLVFGSEQYCVVTGNTVVGGRDFAYMDIEKANRVCLIGSAVKNLLFNYKDPVGETISINNQKFTVVGVIAERMDSSQWSEDNFIAVPYTHLKLLQKTTMMEQFIVKGKDPASTVKAVDQLKGFLLTMYKNRSNAYYSVSTMNQAIEESNELEQQSERFMGLIAGISLLVGGIGIMNIMLITVTERTREIGIRKAIGAERRSIVTQFLVESSVVSGLGGVVGVIVGILVTILWIKLDQNKIFYPSVSIMAIAFGFSVALGLIFGIYPAAKASRLQPVDALRNE